MADKSGEEKKPNGVLNLKDEIEKGDFKMPPGKVEPLPETPPEGVKVETLGVPYFKDKFLIVTDEQNEGTPDVLVFTVPIKKLAMDPGRSPLAMLLGEIELFKGEAHKLFKNIRMVEQSKGPKILMPGGGVKPIVPGGRA